MKKILWMTLAGAASLAALVLWFIIQLNPLSGLEKSLPKNDTHHLDGKKASQHKGASYSAGHNNKRDAAEPRGGQAVHNALTIQRKLLSHPSYSQPYGSVGASFQQWNSPHPVDIPILDGEEHLSLRLSHFHYVYPDAIKGKVDASVGVGSVRLELIDVRTGTTLHIQQSKSEFLIPLELNWPRQLRIKATVEFDGGSEELSTDLNAHYSVATIKAINDARVNQQDLVSEVTLHTEKPGIYRLRGILEEEKGTRLAIVTATEFLGAGSQTLMIKIHHSVLPNKTVELALTNLVIEKMSSRPGEAKRYGRSERMRWPIGKVNPDRLDQTPYSPSQQEQQQLELLKKL
ncbi:hypothetical protein [Idiomarina loihiensis]|uniref:hypothetical protein n=1 Tax=Idiomarina loihiensis TaxID=135577 RepID=UPI0038502B3A